jgi:hypothetical protein
VIPTLRSTRGRTVGVIDRNEAAGVEVGTTTITPRWYGDPLDLGHITTALWCTDRQRPDRN